MRRLAPFLILLCSLQGASQPSEASGPAPVAAVTVTAGPLIAGPVATFRLINDNSTANAERVVSFGQMFRRGSMRPGQPFKTVVKGAVIDAQMDAKAFYPDGSIRHGVVSLKLPPMSGGSEITGVLQAEAGPKTPSSAGPSAPPPPVSVTIAFAVGPSAGKPLRVDLPILAQKPPNPRATPWLTGPLVSERRYFGPVVQGIQVVFDVWTPIVGPSRVDVVVHNDSADNSQIGTQTYDAVIQVNGSDSFRTGPLTHYAFANWKRTIWTDGRAPPRMIPDVALLKEIGAIPRYLEFRPDPAKTAELNRLSTNGAGPLGFGAWTPYMPTTGGRADLGPLPAWAAFYLADPSRQNQQTLMANADVAGSIPWHVRDPRTDGPININQHPDVWLDGRGQAKPGILERKYYTLDTKWQTDDAHQPSVAYLPYLLTGSQYYRDELSMQAGYVLLAMDPAARHGANGSVLGSQVRAVAWDLRTLANAAFILPSDTPWPMYFREKLQGNLQEINRRYVAGHELDTAGELRGYIPGPYAVDGATPPWQDDYLAIVLGWVDSMGFSDAKPVLAWMTNFVAGRFTNPAKGYDPIYGTPYYLMVADPHSQQLLNSWLAAFKWTFSASKPVTGLDSPDWAGGYAALARASLASIINATGSAQARDAYAFVLKHTPKMPDSYSLEPNFAIGLIQAPAPQNAKVARQ